MHLVGGNAQATQLIELTETGSLRTRRQQKLARDVLSKNNIIAKR
jgi:hypothetical protein